MSMTRFACEMRAAITGRKLAGHASVFGQVADVGAHYEQMRSSAFDEVLGNPDTDARALWNHNPDYLLGRMRSGTLRVGVDSEGLEYELDLPNTQIGNDIRELAARGDLNGASFAFIPGADEWGQTPDGRQLRSHVSVKALVDISPVTYPAYSGASTMLRAYEFQPARRGRSDLVRARARVLLGGS